MSRSESERNIQKYSESLFSDSDSAQALARIEQAVASERRRRQLIFMKYILPCCIVLLLFVGYILRGPVMYIFHGTQRLEMPPEHDSEHVSGEAVKRHQQVFGNPDAAMKLYLRFMDEAFAPEGILELAHSAVESKPSEIFLTLEFRQGSPEEGNYQILINDQSEISVDKKEGPHNIDFRQTLKEEDFILALETVHAEIYGEASKPLKLGLSEEILAKRRRQQEAAPPVILPGKSSAEVNASDKAILLPDFKADTTVISP